MVGENWYQVLYFPVCLQESNLTVGFAYLSLLNCNLLTVDGFDHLPVTSSSPLNSGADPAAFAATARLAEARSSPRGPSGVGGVRRGTRKSYECQTIPGG